MRSTIIIGLAALSLFVVGCERKDATPAPESNVGGGPTNKTGSPTSPTPAPNTNDKTPLTADTHGGTVVGTKDAAESMAGGGAKTGAGAVAPAMNDKAVPGDKTTGDTTK